MENQAPDPHGETGQDSPPAESTFVIYNERTKESEVWTGAEVEEDRAFQLALAATPRPIVTPALIAINAVVFIAMAVKGLSIMDPSLEGLLRWGADFGPLTMHGQWWRLLTACFVHIGIIHIAMNMFILWGIGTFTERLFGRTAFTVMYLLAGIGGNLASVAWQPFVVAAGASGAVFGVYGALLGYLLVQRHTVPPRRIKHLYKTAGTFLAYNIVYGMAKSNVDIAAHIGGFVTGVVLGGALALPLVAPPSSRLWRALAVAVVASALAAGAALRIPVVDNWAAELARLGPIESNALNVYNDALTKLKAGQSTDREFVQIVDQQILPPWNEERESILKLRISAEQRTIADQVAAYMALRTKAWTLMEQGILANDVKLVRDANQAQADAQAIVEQMSNANKK